MMSPLLEENVSLLPYNTFGLAVRARYFARFASVAELQALLQLPAVQAMPKLVLGGGSNLLLTQDFAGVVLKNEILGLTVEPGDGATALVRAGSGESWHGLVEFSLAQGLSGLENLSLIPGTVGAAPLQNIGAYGAELRDTFEELEAVEIATGTLRRFGAAACAFGYRESVFKHTLKGQYIITAVVLRLHRSAQPNVRYGAIEETLAAMGVQGTPTPLDVSRAVTHIRRTKLPDPAVTGNAGSFFKNPELPRAQYDALRARYPELPGYPTAEGVKVPAAWLIEQAGWKGQRRGPGAGTHGVHDRQALVLVHLGGAQGHDLLTLARDIMASVQEKFGVQLHPEVNIL